MDPLPDPVVKAIVDPISRNRDFDGCVVIFEHRGEVAILRRPLTEPDQLHAIIISPRPAGGGLEEPAPGTPGWKEWVGTGLSCTGAVLAGIGTGGATVGSVFSVGAATPLAVLAASAAIGSAAQCGIGVGRLINHYTDPRKNEILDNTAWWNNSLLVLDVISLLNVAAGLSKAGAASWKAYTSTVNQAERMGLGQALRKLPADDRAKVLDELFKRTGIKLGNKAGAAFMKNGKLPSWATKADKVAGRAVRDAAKAELVAKISQQALEKAVREVSIEIMKNIPDLAGSAMGGVISKVPDWLKEDTKITAEVVNLSE
jgi:hypothetical protein